MANHESNGRWKVSPITALTLAINLVGWGITVGTILTKLDSLEKKATALELKISTESYVTKEVFDARVEAANKERALMWDAIRRRR